MYKNYLVAFITIFLFYSCDKHNNTYEINGFTMGTTYSVKIIENALDSSKVRSHINSILDSINMDMSTYIESSSISEFNNYNFGRKYRISNDFHKVLVSSKYFSKLTGGAFDITVNPLVELWGFSKKSSEKIKWVCPPRPHPISAGEIFLFFFLLFLFPRPDSPGRHFIFFGGSPLN